MTLCARGRLFTAICRLGLFSRVVHIHKIKAGDTVGYGATYKCNEDTWIGTIPIGYADGYPRCLSNTGEVLIGGRRYKVAGRVCMDQLMVDLGSETDVKVGDEVVLIGRQGDWCLSAGRTMMKLP